MVVASSLRSFLFHGGLEIVQVLQQRVPDHTFEEKHHGNRHERGNHALRLGLVAPGQHDAPLPLGDSLGSQEHEPPIFCPGAVVLVLDSLGNPLFDRGGLSEKQTRLSPSKSDKAVRRFFKQLDLLNAAQNAGCVFDVSDDGLNRLPGTVINHHLCLDDHRMPPAFRRFEEKDLDNQVSVSTAQNGTHRKTRPLTNLALASPATQYGEEFEPRKTRRGLLPQPNM